MYLLANSESSEASTLAITRPGSPAKAWASFSYFGAKD